ncbi:unnamed protein product [Linum trigynum]|uniref:Uncharacterized protein n=1 Tax=Linum trigynum TaxID=586398 RepID=A0AAV2F1C3_9ROSI
MDELLCDELLQEIFTRIPSAPPPSIPLVSKRWLCLYRASKTFLSLRITLDHHQHQTSNSSAAATALFRSFSSFLSHYPFLSSLSLLLDDLSCPRSPSFNDRLLFLISSLCFKLKQLKFLPYPVSVISLRSLSNSCTLLTSLTVSLSRPLLLHWVAWFASLKELSVSVCDGDERGIGFSLDEGKDSELGLESVSFAGIGRDDSGLGFLWRSCKKLKKLSLKSCEGIGDGGSFSSFTHCLIHLQELELRTCRNIADGVLLRLAEHSASLNSLLVYDGGSRDGLLHFITNSKCQISNLDFRLPLDLSNEHLSAVATNFKCLKSLRLQSCCLVSGEGLKALGIAMSSGLEELALINCDVVERESGLLATLGQNLKQLRKLDLSYNEYLFDKEFIGMLASCCNLVDLKIRGCRGLTGLAMVAVSRSCKKLERVDVVHCNGITADGVETLVVKSSRLRRVQVEETKVSDVARGWANRRFVEVSA